MSPLFSFARTVSTPGALENEYWDVGPRLSQSVHEPTGPYPGNFNQCVGPSAANPDIVRSLEPSTSFSDTAYQSSIFDISFTIYHSSITFTGYHSTLAKTDLGPADVPFTFYGTLSHHKIISTRWATGKYR